MKTLLAGLFTFISVNATADTLKCIDEYSIPFGLIRLEHNNATLIDWGDKVELPNLTTEFTISTDNRLYIPYQNNQNIILNPISNELYLYDFAELRGGRHCYLISESEAVAYHEQLLAKLPKGAPVKNGLRFDDPTIGLVVHVAATSNLDQVCKKLVGQNSVYINNSLIRSSKVRFWRGVYSSISHSQVYFVDQSGSITQGRIDSFGKRWIEQITCSNNN